METEKAAELIEKSEHIGLLLPAEQGIDAWAAAEVLARALEEKGKAVGFFPVASTAQKPPEIFRSVLASAPLTREFIVSLDTSPSAVAELRYEKHDGRIDMILSPKAAPIRKESFSFRDGDTQCDCIVAIGISDIEGLPATPSMDPRILLETPIINIDAREENRRYGEVNLISGEKMSLSQIAYELLQKLSGSAPAGEPATLLLAGIMTATDSFDSPETNASTMSTAAALLQAGALYAGARRLARADAPLSLVQLASRTAVRSKEDADAGVLWSFLTADDFEKTGRTARDLPFVLRRLSSLAPPRKAHVILWQDPQEKDIRAVIHADAPVLEQIASREPGSFQSPHFGITARFANFQEAEDHIATLLKEAP